MAGHRQSAWLPRPHRPRPCVRPARRADRLQESVAPRAAVSAGMDDAPRPARRNLRAGDGKISARVVGPRCCAHRGDNNAWSRQRTATTRKRERGSSMLKLYNAAHSTCSQKVRICLAEKDLPFEDIKLDLGKGKDHLKPEYLKINPNGVVPTLVDDGSIIVDSSVI